jgi:hypothetical protein
MIRAIIITIALSSFGALSAQAQPASPPGPKAASPAAPGEGPGASNRGLGKPGHEDRGKADKRKDGMEKPADEAAKQAERQERVTKLKERAAQLRKDGKDKQAEMLEKQAERMASGTAGMGGEKSQANREKVRTARKLARVKLLQRRYGESLKQDDVRGEVESHARRSAHLSRMKELVSSRPDGDDKLKATKQKMLDRINRLMARENARHSRLMAQLTKKDKLAGKDVPKIDPAATGSAPAQEEGQK